MAIGEKRRKTVEIFYTALTECEPRHGVIRLEFQSGSHREGGSIPFSVAMELYERLGAIFRDRASDVKALPRS